MVNLTGQFRKTVLKIKLGFAFTVAVLLLTSCETTSKRPDMTGPIISAKMRKQVPEQPVKPSLESQKLKDWIQL